QALAQAVPGKLYYQVPLPVTLARRGRHAEAAQHAEALRAGAPTGPAHLILQSVGAQALAPAGAPLGPMTQLLVAVPVSQLDAFALGAPTNPDVLFAVARCYAQCCVAADTDAEKQDYARKAVEALRAATGKDYKDVFGLETDPDLEPLQAHPEFR